MGLNQALTFVRPGDVLVVWKLDRLGRSLSHLLCIVNTLKEKQVSVAVIEMAAGVTTACFTPCSRAPSAQVTLFFFWRVSAAAVELPLLHFRLSKNPNMYTCSIIV